MSYREPIARFPGTPSDPDDPGLQPRLAGLAWETPTEVAVEVPVEAGEDVPPSGPSPVTASFQSASSLQGRQFADQCDLLLTGSGFRLGDRVFIPEIGVEIDREALAPSGRMIWFEYKGSLQGPRPGLLRTDTLKKAIANGALLGALGEHPPFVVLTSHVPEGGSGLAMLDSAKAMGFVHDVICVYRPGDAARLRAL